MCKVQLTDKNAILNSESYKEDFGSINAELREIKLDFGFNQESQNPNPDLKAALSNFDFLKICIDNHMVSIIIALIIIFVYPFFI